MNRRNLLKTLSITLGSSMITTKVIGQIAEDTFVIDDAPAKKYQPILVFPDDNNKLLK